MSRVENCRPRTVTVIGLGDMGTALAEAFLAAGHITTVANRTPSRADPLVPRGALRAQTVHGAVTASGLIVVCIFGYDAVRSTLNVVEDFDRRTLDRRRAGRVRLLQRLEGRLGRAHGVLFESPKSMLPLVEKTPHNVSGWLRGLADQIEAGTYPPDGDIHALLRAINNFVDESTAGGINTEVPLLLRRFAAQAVSDGDGGNGYPAIALVLRGKGEVVPAGTGAAMKIQTGEPRASTSDSLKRPRARVAE